MTTTHPETTVFSAATTTIRRAAAFALVALMLAIPAGAAAQDLRTPDARDAVTAPRDLRSPDTRDPFLAPRTVKPVVAPSSDAFPWAYLAVGAGLASALVAGTVTGVRRRHRVGAAVA